MAGTDIEAVKKKIEKQAKASFFAGVVGLFFFGIVFGPGAMIRGNIAKRLIKEHGVGQEHESSAKLGVTLGAVAIVLWIGILGLKLGGVF